MLKKKMIFLSVTSLFFLTLVLFERVQRQQILDFRQMKSDLNQAVLTSKNQMISHLYTLKQDPIFLQNVVWNLTHSVQGTLQSFLRNRELDALYLFDSQCGLVAQASSGASPGSSISCHDFPQKRRLLGGSWLQENPVGPFLSFSLPLQTQDEKNYLLVGSTVLDEAWVALYPNLKKWMLRHGVTVANPNMAKNGQNRLVANTEPELWIESERTYWIQFASQFFTPAILQGTILWVGSILILLCLAIVWGWRKQWQFKLQQQSEIFEKIQSSWNQVRGGGGGVSSNFEKWDNIRQFTDALQEYMNQVHSQIQSYQQGLLSTQKENEGLRLQLNDTKHQIKKMIEFESLAFQSSSIQEQLTKLAEKSLLDLEQAGDYLTHGMHRSCQAFCGILNEWRQGIHERGARRFFRQLTEVEGSEHDTLLGEQLQQLLNLGNQIASQSIQSSLKLKALAPQVQRMIQLQQHLQGVLHSEADSEHLSPSTLVDSLLSAQDLLRLNPSWKRVHIENDIEFALQTMPLPWTKSHFVSTLYHIHFALYSTDQEPAPRSPQFIVKMRQRGETYAIVFSSSCIKRQKDGSLEFNPSQKYHLALAQKMADRLNMKVQWLPLVDEMVSLSLNFNYRDKEVPKQEPTEVDSPFRPKSKNVEREI